MWQRGIKFLTAFYQRGFQKDRKPLALEQSFILKVSPDLRLGGRIDRIDKLPDETLEIIDYKTGKVASQKEVDKNSQLTFYAMAISGLGLYQQSPENVILSFYFLETQEKVSTRRTIEDLEKAKKAILIKAQEIAQAEFLPKPGPWCDFCEYKLLCPAWI